MKTHSTNLSACFLFITALCIFFPTLPTILFFTMSPLSPGCTKVVLGTAVCTGVRCAVGCWGLQPLSSLTLLCPSRSRHRSSWHMEAGLSWRGQARCASLQLAHCSAMLPSRTAVHQASVQCPNLSAGTQPNHSDSHYLSLQQLSANP